MASKSPIFIKTNDDPIQLQVANAITEISSNFENEVEIPEPRIPTSIYRTKLYGINTEAAYNSVLQGIYVGSASYTSLFTNNHTYTTTDNQYIYLNTITVTISEIPYALSIIAYSGNSGADDPSQYYFNTVNPPVFILDCPLTNPIVFSELLAAGEEGVPLLENVGDTGQGATNFKAEDAVLYLSCINNGDSTYTFTYTIRPNPIITAVADITATDVNNNTTNINILPLINKIGGSIIEEPIEGLEKKLDLLQFDESIYIDCYASEEDFHNDQSLEGSDYELTSESVTLTFNTRPMYFRVNCLLDQNDQEYTMGCNYYLDQYNNYTYTDAEISHLPNGIRLMQATMSNNDYSIPNFVESSTKIYGLLTENNNQYTLQIFITTNSTQPILQLQPSLNSSINLTPLIENCITNIDYQYIPNGIPFDIGYCIDNDNYSSSIYPYSLNYELSASGNECQITLSTDISSISYSYPSINLYDLYPQQPDGYRYNVYISLKSISVGDILTESASPTSQNTNTDNRPSLYTVITEIGSNYVKFKTFTTLPNKLKVTNTYKNNKKIIKDIDFSELSASNAITDIKIEYVKSENIVLVDNQLYDLHNSNLYSNDVTVSDPNFTVSAYTTLGNTVMFTVNRVLTDEQQATIQNPEYAQNQYKTNISQESLVAQTEIKMNRTIKYAD